MCWLGVPQGTFKIWDLVPARAGVAFCLMSIRLPSLTGAMTPEAFAFKGDTSAIVAGRSRLHMFMVRVLGPWCTSWLRVVVALRLSLAPPSMLVWRLPPIIHHFSQSCVGMEACTCAHTCACLCQCLLGIEIVFDFAQPQQKVDTNVLPRFSRYNPSLLRFMTAADTSLRVSHGFTHVEYLARQPVYHLSPDSQCALIVYGTGSCFVSLCIL